MKKSFSRLAIKGWGWLDYFQLIHSIFFAFFGLLILIRLGTHVTLLGLLVGGSFLLFGLYRLKYFIQFFSRYYLKTGKGSSLR